MRVQSLSWVRLFATPWGVAHQAPLDPWDFPGKNTGVGCHFLLLEIFLTQGLNRVSCIGRRILYLWAIWEAPKIRRRGLQILTQTCGVKAVLQDMVQTEPVTGKLDPAWLEKGGEQLLTGDAKGWGGAVGRGGRDCFTLETAAEARAK